MIKNQKDKFQIKWDFRNKGNWNYKNPRELAVCTKPIAVAIIDGNEFVFEHWDIMDIIKAYHKVDKESIHMIRSGQSGNVKYAETTLLEKLTQFIKELKNEDAFVQDSKFLKDGQKALRIE